MAGAPRRYGILGFPVGQWPRVDASSVRRSVVMPTGDWAGLGSWLAAPDETQQPSLTGPGWGPIYASSPQLQAAPYDPALQNPKRGTAAFRVASRQVWSYSDPMEVLGVALFRRQAIVTKAPQQYGTDEFALGHYQPFRMPRPVGGGDGDRPVLAEMHNSAFQPISRGGHVLISLTESNTPLGAAGRTFANTRFGLWFKAWVVGGANIRPLGTMQTPSPQFRGVLPNYGYMTLPRVIGQ